MEKGEPRGAGARRSTSRAPAPGRGVAVGFEAETDHHPTRPAGGRDVGRGAGRLPRRLRQRQRGYLRDGRDHGRLNRRAGDRWRRGDHGRRSGHHRGRWGRYADTRRHAPGRRGRQHERHHRRPVHRGQGRSGPPGRGLGAARQLRQGLQRRLRQRARRGGRGEGRRPLRDPPQGGHRVPRRQAGHRGRRDLLVPASPRSRPRSGAGARRAARRLRADEGRRPDRAGPAQAEGGDLPQRPGRVHGDGGAHWATSGRTRSRSAPGLTC